MTNVLDLSRSFCYNNNREVKARTTRRTREAMASELKLPQHYVELDQQEMEYLDGGAYLSSGFCAAIGVFAGAVSLTAWGVVGVGAFAGVNMLAIAGSKLILLGAKIAGAVGAFCLANPWAVPIVGFVMAWAACNYDNFLELGVNIIKAAVTGRGVKVGISWFQLQSSVA